MRGFWLIVVGALVGCAGTPKREMRPPAVEEIPLLPAKYGTAPPDVPRTEPLLAPKPAAPPMNAGPGANGFGMPGPGGMPGAGR